jgi:phage-related protein
VDTVPISVHTEEVGANAQTATAGNPGAVLPSSQRTRTGTGLVADFGQGIIGIDLMRVQFGWPIGMPLVRSLKDGLWEVRSNLASPRIARLLLCSHQETLVVLHGFIKRSQKTVPADLALAVRRMKEVMN